jgi:hypothetical protein
MTIDETVPSHQCEAVTGVLQFFSGVWSQLASSGAGK